MENSRLLPGRGATFNSSRGHEKNLSKKILHFQVSEQLQEGESVEALGEAETASNGATTAIRKKGCLAVREQRTYFFQACLWEDDLEDDQEASVSLSAATRRSDPPDGPAWKWVFLFYRRSAKKRRPTK